MIAPARPAPHTLPTEVLDLLLDQHDRLQRPRSQRLWAYYRNALPAPSHSGGASGGASGDGGGPGRDWGGGDRLPPQARGLPERLRRPPGRRGADREIVLENDIAWRVHTLADFMFARPVALQSLAPDPARAADIEAFLNAVFDANGGICFFQDLALLGSIYGFVDILLRLPDPPAGVADFQLDTVEAPRAVPVLQDDDYRRLDAYILRVLQQTHDAAPRPFLHKVRDRVLGQNEPARRAVLERTEVWTPRTVQRFVNPPRQPRRLVDESVNRLGRLPVIHIQNLPQPFHYEGLSEVEPLIPLQDELNTRLSDRANRVTFQSFKMYLGKGIESFHERPVGPGQMWSTDNLNASIEAFGGDGAAPSEDAHIQEIREALDKTSGVSPLATGLVRDKVGNLTSENALRIVMMGLLAKTEKKRVTYGQGIGRLAELILHAADLHGLLPNTPDDRRIRLDWPDPLPDSETQRLHNAQLKLELGVPQRQVLAELGYQDLQAIND